jgi:hypothetical protein
MSRIFRIKDPLVDVIYIAPYPLTKEITDYYVKIMELVEIEKSDSRFTIVIPENYVKFPRSFSLTQALLYSPKAIKSVKKLIDGK